MIKQKKFCQKAMDDPNIKFKGYREKIHPEINNYNDIDPVQKLILQEIKDFVFKVCPNVKLFLTGSRINGRWIEESDYDIIIEGNLVEEEKKLFKDHKFMGQVDFKFNVRTANAVEIL